MVEDLRLHWCRFHHYILREYDDCFVRLCYAWKKRDVVVANNDTGRAP